MKNSLIFIGILLFITSIFLPWGPTGTAIETGFNDEASPGLIGILPAIFSLYFAFKTTKKAYYILLLLGVLLTLLPVTVINKIAGNESYGILQVNYGIYIMILGSILIIYGTFKGLRNLHVSTPPN